MKQENIIQKLKELIRELESEKPDPYAELKAAHAAGKVIQFYSDHRGVWIDSNNPSWLNIVQYRIKPEEPKQYFAQIPDGYEEIPDEECNGQVVDGAKFFNTMSREWAPCTKATKGFVHIRPIKTKPRLIPLGPDDVPPFSVIRRKNEAQQWHWRLLSYVHGVGVQCGNRGYEWDEMKDDYEINRSLSLGKWDASAWEPCSKEDAE